MTRDVCYCCFVAVEPGQFSLGEAIWRPAGGTTVIHADLKVCHTCRRLECDVLNPFGCKNPDAFVEEASL